MRGAAAAAAAVKIRAITMPARRRVELHLASERERVGVVAATVKLQFGGTKLKLPRHSAAAVEKLKRPPCP